MSDRPLYCFAGGGTGGHLTPGLALATELQKDDPQSRVLFLGSSRPLETKLVGAVGYEHCALPLESSESLARNPLRFAWHAWRGYRHANRLLRKRRPAAVIGLGGFASVPTVVAATRLRIPTLILEQNAFPGRATRFLSGRVDAVCLAFEAARPHLRGAKRVELTGNPLREEIARLSRETASDGACPTLLVLGGSQGAESLNEALLRVVECAPPELAGWRIVHQTGAAQAGEVESTYLRRGIDHVVAAFFDDLATWYRETTLVVSRAGATTLTELACAGCPAILVPFPHAADQHQHANARVFADAGAAMVVEHAASPEQTARAVASAVGEIARDSQRRRLMREAMRNLARPEAAATVLAVLRSIL